MTILVSALARTQLLEAHIMEYNCSSRELG